MVLAKFLTLAYLSISRSFLHLEIWKLHQTSLNDGTYRLQTFFLYPKAEIKF